MQQRTASNHADRYAGCLIGQALGDALGFLVEGHSPAECEAYVATVMRSRALLDQRRGPFRFGQYSDDTQLAREMMQSFVACRGFDRADYARRIADLFTEQRIVGRGRATENAARRLAAGVDLDQAGEPAPSAGNGSAMRAAPVGLFFPRDAARVVEAACQQGELTHRDPRATAGAVCIAFATHMLLAAGPLETHVFVARLFAATRSLSAELAASLLRLPGWLELEPPAAAEQISREGRAPGHADGWLGISPFVTPSVLWSLYSFLRSPDDYWTAIETAIAAGGDVDTTAAMTGALSGCRVGLSRLPGDLCRRVNDQGRWGYDELVALATRCSEIASESPHER